MERNDYRQTRRRRTSPAENKTPPPDSPIGPATLPARRRISWPTSVPRFVTAPERLKDSLADALETGANKLRQRPAHGDLAGSTGGGSVAVESDGRLAAVSTNVAGGMQTTASWLRETDIESLKTGIEKQVKEHPARSLLIAIGVGYLIGKAFRR